MSLMEYELGKHPGPPERERVEVDPITLRVLGGAFHAIAKEMAGVLFRMSYSSIIRESEDLGAGIFDYAGRELCESDSTPMHIGSLPWYIRGFMHRLQGQVQDGDVIIHNHPYLGASHSPDIAVAVPIFHEGEHLGFAAVTAHAMTEDAQKCLRAGFDGYLTKPLTKVALLAGIRRLVRRPLPDGASG